MSIDMFRIGLAFILLGLLFPLIEFISKYTSVQTAQVTLVTWIVGIVLILSSAFFKEKLYIARS